MNNFVRVEILHALCDLFGPRNESHRRDNFLVLQYILQCAMGAKLHYNTIHWRRRTNSPGKAEREAFCYDCVSGSSLGVFMRENMNFVVLT